jgi:hypothetical protein
MRNLRARLADQLQSARNFLERRIRMKARLRPREFNLLTPNDLTAQVFLSFLDRKKTLHRLNAFPISMDPLLLPS